MINTIFSQDQVTALIPHNRVRRPVLRYHGGKFRLAPNLIELFPDHAVYTEAYGGGGSVLMLKPRCYSEIYNDLDGEVVNVFRVLQDRKKAARLEAALRVTPFARAEFELSYKHTRSEVERARRTIIRSFMGFGSDSITRTKNSNRTWLIKSHSYNRKISGFRANSNRCGTTAAGDWANYPNHISEWVERLQGVFIEHRDAHTVLEKMDREECLHYVDPPYPFGQRSDERSRYTHEMNDADHKELSALLHSLKGMVIVSSYPGPVYERLYRTWKKVSWTSGQFCSQNSGSKTRTECVWMNKAAVRAQRQGFLFKG